MTPETLLSRWLAEARALMRLAAPLVAAQLALISMSTVDTIMAGQLSARDLAAVALGGSIWVAAFVFSMGVVLSVQPTVAHLFGAGNDREVGYQVRQGLWLALLMAVPLVLALLCAEAILRRMHAPPDVIPLTVGYLRAMACGAPAMLAYSVLRSYCEGVSDTFSIMAVSLVGLASNICGNYLFMYGYWGGPPLGAVGTGVASALVMWIMLGSLVARIARSERHRRFGCFRQFDLPEAPEILTLVRLGAPMGASLFLECSLFSLVALWMGSMGKVVVSAHQVAMNFAATTFMVPLGISMAITVRVGQALGRKDVHGARLAGLTGVSLAVGVMSLAALLMLLFPQQIAAVYTRDPDVQATAVLLLGMAAIFQISDGLQVAGAGALRGMKDTTIPLLITITAYWGVGLPLALGLGFHLDHGPRGLWTGLIAGLTAAAVLLNIRFHRLTLRRLATEDAVPSRLNHESASTLATVEST